VTRALNPKRLCLLLLVLALGYPLLALAAEGGGGGAGGLGVLLIFATLVVLAILGEPLFVILAAIATLCFLLYADGYDSFDAFQLFIVKIANISTKNILLAIPFFVVSGAIMSAGTIASRLINLARALTAWLPGGLAVSTVVACAFFGMISGSSPVTVIAIGSIMLPALVKARYPEGFSTGILTAGGSLGIVFPPSIPMLVYALVASAAAPVDVSEMFLAGVVPGLFLVGLLSAYAIITGYRKKIPTTPFDGRAVLTAFREGVWALGLPVVILGGIYSGLFTPTEAAAVSVAYALVVEFLIHRQLKWQELRATLLESGVALGALLMIMALTFGLNDFLVLQRIPEQAAAWIASRNMSPFEFVLALNLLLILVGCLMDAISAILILTPLLVPIGYALGLDLVHLGVIFIVNLEIGYLTPPVGMNLFVASTVFRRPLGEVIRGTLPYVGILAVGLVFISYVPTLSLGAVNSLLRKTDFYVAFPSAIPPTVAGAASPSDAPPDETPAPEGVKTLQQMMEEARRRAEGAEEGEETAPAPAAPGKVKTMQEMMEEARRRAAETPGE
jgi:C4-dicarboxylate transporter DctM subunit